MESNPAEDSYTIRAVVYVEEDQAGQDWIVASGYRATITCQGETIERAVICPLRDLEKRMVVPRNSYAWQAVEAFVAALPSLRVRSTIDERRSAKGEMS